MKSLMLMALLVTLGSATSAHALIIDDKEYSSACNGSSGERDALGCLFGITTSLPTLIVAADVNEMNEVEVRDFARAEAQNYVDGVEGEYLLLKKTASAMDLSVDQVAQDILSAK